MLPPLGIAGVLEDDFAVSFIMLVQDNAGMGITNELAKLGLALLDREPPQVVTVELFARLLGEFAADLHRKGVKK
jgi:hypothetical protein